MRAVLKWIRVALLVWGALSLVGIAAVLALAYSLEASYAADRMSPEEMARLHVERVWGSARPYLALVDTHETAEGADTRGGLRISAIRIDRGVESAVGLAPRTTGDAAYIGADPMQAAAIAHLESRLRLPGPAWLPSPAGLRGRGMQLLVYEMGMHFGRVDHLTLYAVRSSDHMLFVFEETE